MAGDCISLLKTNAALFAVDLRTENDGPWIGKDDEFATQNFLTNWDVAGALDGYLSSEKAALFVAFGLGKAVKSDLGGGAFQYTCTPLDPVADEIEMPATTVVEAIRQGGSAVIDRALVGVVCEEFGFQFNSGPGLQASRLTSQWVGSGWVDEPSGIVIPAHTAEHLVPAYDMTWVMLTDDYITAKTVQSAEFRWRNNIRLDSGFYPGSGSNRGAQVRGRMEHGDRECAFSAVARFQSGSTELTKLLAQTEGTMVLTVTGGEIVAGSPGINHSITITLHRVVYRSAVIGDAEGIVTVAVETLPMKHASNGLVTIDVITGVDDILTAAA